MLSHNCLFAHLWQSKATMLLSKAKGQFASISFYYLITICCHLQHYNKSLDYLIFIFTSQMLNVGLARLRLRTLGCHLRIERQKSKNFWDLYWSQDIRHPTSHHTSSNIIYCNMCKCKRKFLCTKSKWLLAESEKSNFWDFSPVWSVVVPDASAVLIGSCGAFVTHITTMLDNIRWCVMGCRM